MRKGNCLWLCIVATLMLTTVGMAQDKNRNPDERQRGREMKERAAQGKMAAFVRQRIEPLLQSVSESVSQRYDLDETTVNELRRDVRQSVEIVLKQPEGMRAFAGTARTGNNEMLEALLSQPDCKAAFAKHLNEEQLQDYLDFTQARRQRDPRAVSRQLTVWVDQQLSLTNDQRHQVEQLLFANTGGGWQPTSIHMLEMHPQRLVHLVGQRLKGRMDGVLSETQSKIWQELVPPAKSRNRRANEDRDPKAMFARAEAEIMEALKAGKITREEVGQKLEALKKELWGEKDDEDEGNGKDEDDVVEPEEKARLIAFRRAEEELEAMVEAGRITREQTNERLAGLKERLWNKNRNRLDRREVEFRRAEEELEAMVEAGRITREQANERLAGLKERLWGKDEDDVVEPEEKARLIAEAKLAAHTEQLGPLDERASRRLALVAKGVVEEYLEAQSEDREAMYRKAENEIMEAVDAGKMTREQAFEKLGAMREELWDERNTNERRRESSADITNHPLYQQTIKDVLSEDALAQYKARQAERQAFRQQALRDVVVACVDTHLFLADNQREHFEVTAAELSGPPATDEVALGHMLSQLSQRVDRELLSPWQRDQFEGLNNLPGFDKLPGFGKSDDIEREKRR